MVLAFSLLGPRRVIQANCRAQFTADDFSFVVQVLAKSPQEATSLVRLLSDEEERDAILDHDLVCAAVLDRVDCLRVSAAFYFYVLTRRVLKRTALEDRTLCDYVAALLLAFSRTSRLAAPAGEGGEEAAARNFVYLADLLRQVERGGPEEACARRAHLADVALFFSGVFAERVEAHARRRGAPGLSFYESVGRSAYLSAARHPQARRRGLQAVFEQLGDDFREVRLALNHLAESLLHLHPAPAIAWPPGTSA